MKHILYIIVLSFFSVFSSTNGAFYPPSIVEYPIKDGTYHENEALIMRCKATGNPEPAYQWYKDGRKFDYSLNTGRYTKWPKEGTIVLARPSYDDDGIYRCTATNDRGTAVTNEVNIRRAEIQDFGDSYKTNLDPIMEGDSVFLRCSVPLSYPPALVEWEKRTSTWSGLLKDSSKYVKDYDGNLYITRLTYDSDNQAEFRCTAFNLVMRTRKTAKPYVITVTKSSQSMKQVQILSKSIRNVKAVIGTQTVLRCILGGNPQVNFRWEKQTTEGLITSRLEQDRPNIRIEAGGPLLVINPVMEQDKGKYLCFGDNDATYGHVIVEFVLEVFVPPKLTISLKNVNVPQGGTAEFTCAAAGDPNPTIIWLFNGKPILEHKFTGSLDISPNVIRITNVGKDDYGVFQCNATSHYGYDISNGYLNILQDKPEFITQPPPKLVKAEDQTINLPCETFSAPKAIVSWVKDGYPISGGRYLIQDNGDLLIEKAITADSGSYTCSARNEYGMVSGTTEVYVRQKTELMIKPINTWVYTDQEVKFVCTAKTDRLETPNLRINWYKNYNKIEFERNGRIQKNLQDNSLIIMGAMIIDNGVYMCNATNGIDYAVGYALLIVQAAPYMPTQVKAECNTLGRTNIALVTWAPGSDNFAPIIQFIVEYSDQFDRELWWPVDLTLEKNSLIPGTKMSAEIPMKPGIKYSFRVSAQNRVGISEPSIPSHIGALTDCKIPETKPTTNPKNVFIYGTNLNNLVVRWTKMPRIEYNGKAFTYKLTLRCLECSTNKVNTTIVDETVNEVIYYNFKAGPDEQAIEAYKKFQVEIVACNEIGCNYLNPANATGYSGDGMPTYAASDFNVTGQSSGALDLEWTVIKESELDEVKGFFRGYRIEWCLDSLSPEECNKTRKFEDVIMQDYVHPVRYHNMVKRSIGENAIPNEYRDEDHIYRLGERIVRRDIHDDEELIRKKRAALKKPEEWNFETKFKWTMKLIPGDIKIKIWARVLNNLWAGSVSNIVVVTTSPSTPGPVDNLATIMEGINHVKIQWRAPTDPHGTLTGYRLGWRQIKGLDLGYMTRYPDIETPSMTEFEMSGLESGSRYRIFVWALTTAGQGIESFIDVNTQPANIAPDPPTFIIASIVQNNVTLRFEASQKGVKGSVFKAQYRMYGRSIYEETEPVYNIKEILLHKLANDTLYEVRVMATNGAGMVSASDTKFVKTLGATDPTGPEGENAIWIICTVLIIIFTIILIVLLFVCRDRRMDKLTGGLYDPNRAMHDDAYGAILQQSDLSHGTKSRELTPSAPPSEIPEDPRPLSPPSYLDVVQSDSVVSNQSEPPLIPNDEPIQEKPRKKRKKKRVPKEEEIAENEEEDGGDTII